jgi:hypothetical protein
MSQDDRRESARDSYMMRARSVGGTSLVLEVPTGLVEQFIGVVEGRSDSTVIDPGIGARVARLHPLPSPASTPRPARWPLALALAALGISLATLICVLY